MKTKKVDTFKILVGSLSKDFTHQVFHRIYADNDKLIASNGRILTIIKNSNNLPNGLYDKNLIPVKADRNYPNYNQVIPNDYENHIKIKLNKRIINRPWTYVIFKDGSIYNQDEKSTLEIIGEYCITDPVEKDSIYLKFLAEAFKNITGKQKQFEMFINNNNDKPCKIEYNSEEFSIIMSLRK